MMDKHTQRTASPTRVHIMVCTHQDAYIYGSDIIRPILVGSSLLGERATQIAQNISARLYGSKEYASRVLRDDMGENISALNPYFCELTAMYWAWKNVEAEYYGLLHYRRVLNFNNKVIMRRYHDINRLSIAPNRVIKHFGLEQERLLHELSHSPMITGTPVIVPYSYMLSHSLTQYEIYTRDHRKHDIDVVLAIIRRNYPHMQEFAEKVFFTAGHPLSWCNMFVMRGDLYKEYCEFLFGVLLEAQNSVNITHYNPYQQRIFGFIAERLLNIFMNYKVFCDGLTPLHKPIFELRAPRPWFGSVIAGDTKRTFWLKMRVRKERLAHKG